MVPYVGTVPDVHALCSGGEGYARRVSEDAEGTVEELHPDWRAPRLFNGLCQCRNILCWLSYHCVVQVRQADPRDGWWGLDHEEVIFWVGDWISFLHQWRPRCAHVGGYGGQCRLQLHGDCVTLAGIDGRRNGWQHTGENNEEVPREHARAGVLLASLRQLADTHDHDRERPAVCGFVVLQREPFDVPATSGVRGLRLRGPVVRSADDNDFRQLRSYDGDVVQEGSDTHDIIHAVREYLYAHARRSGCAGVRRHCPSHPGQEPQVLAIVDAELTTTRLQGFCALIQFPRAAACTPEPPISLSPPLSFIWKLGL
mmetsp:Transcript_19318/g.74194  ORF Transcript_19318/g.74194 Transcript_19318/m.74194 type:complete len:313 (+) Transcript_19318:342-1280(+)